MACMPYIVSPKGVVCMVSMACMARMMCMNVHGMYGEHGVDGGAVSHRACCSMAWLPSCVPVSELEAREGGHPPNKGPRHTSVMRAARLTQLA